MVSPVYVTVNLSQSSLAYRNESESYLDLDSHADTCVLGMNALIIETPYPTRTAVVSFADPSVGTVTKNILSGAFKYTTPDTGKHYILIVHQAIHIETMEHSLLCPMQLRENDIILDECPKSMIENPTEVNHSLLVVTETNHLRIPLRLRGVTSTIYVTKPTVQDLDRYEQIELTNRDLLWNPQNPDFAANENSFLDAFGEFISPGDQLNRRKSNRFLNSVNNQTITKGVINSLQEVNNASDRSTLILNEIEPALNDFHFSTMLNDNHFISAVSGVQTGTRKGLSPELLASRWKISLKQAKDTIDATTQRAVRNISNPALSRRFKTNDRMLRYNRVPHTVFTDTLHSTVKSKRQNTHAQVYCTDFNWVRAYPMTSESEAHHTVSQLFKDIGVPDKMVMDNAKTQIHGQFRKKLKDADCQVRSIEPHTPFSNAAEAAIKELKRVQVKNYRPAVALKDYGMIAWN